MNLFIIFQTFNLSLEKEASGEKLRNVCDLKNEVKKNIGDVIKEESDCNDMEKK